MAPPSGVTNTLSQSSIINSLTISHSLAAMDVARKDISSEAASGPVLAVSPSTLNLQPPRLTKMGTLKCPEVCNMPLVLNLCLLYYILGINASRGSMSSLYSPSPQY
jgi:hypothetical protein